jgi:hypothetical protein
MYHDDTELIFPSRVIPTLKGERDGKEWGKLVEKVNKLPPDHPEHLAFVLMMIKINSCTSCHADSFRAMRGCTACSQQNVKRYRGSDADLFKAYEKAQKEIDGKFLKV